MAVLCGLVLREESENSVTPHLAFFRTPSSFSRLYYQGIFKTCRNFFCVVKLLNLTLLSLRIRDDGWVINLNDATPDFLCCGRIIISRRM